MPRPALPYRECPVVVMPGERRRTTDVFTALSFLAPCQPALDSREDLFLLRLRLSLLLFSYSLHLHHAQGLKAFKTNNMKLLQ